MKTKIWKIIFIIVIMISLTTQFSCIEEEDEEIRFYVTDSTPTDSYYISELFIVQSPAGSQGNWGSNILNGNTRGPNVVGNNILLNQAHTITRWFIGESIFRLMQQVF